MGKEERETLLLSFISASCHYHGRNKWQQQGAQRRLQVASMRAQCLSTNAAIRNLTLQPAVIYNINLFVYLSSSRVANRRRESLTARGRGGLGGGARGGYCRRMTMHTLARSLATIAPRSVTSTRCKRKRRHTARRRGLNHSFLPPS